MRLPRAQSKHTYHAYNNKTMATTLAVIDTIKSVLSFPFLNKSNKKTQLHYFLWNLCLSTRASLLYKLSNPRVTKLSVTSQVLGQVPVISTM